MNFSSYTDAFKSANEFLCKKTKKREVSVLEIRRKDLLFQILLLDLEIEVAEPHS